MNTRRSAIAVSAFLLLLAAGCGGGQSQLGGPSAGLSASPPQLKNIQELQRVFNSASREPTLVVLVAPT